MGKWRTYGRRGRSMTAGVIEQFVANLTLAGGSIDATGLNAVTALYSSLATAGVWDRLTQVWPCVGVGLASALQLLKWIPGDPTSYGNVNFIAGNYSQTGGSGGLTGDGATRYLTGAPSNAQMGLDSSFFVSCRAGFAGAGNRFFGGSIAGGDQFWVGSLNPAASVATRLGLLATATLAAAATNNRWTGSRVSASSIALYQDAVSVATDATGITAPTSGQRQFIFAVNSAGSPAGLMACRLTGVAFGLSLSAQNVSDLSSAWATFDSALSR